jgi:hypothetical protein
MTLFRLALPLCSLVLILFTGCESPGRALAKSAVGQIRDGQTTRAEVDKIFGEPRQMTKSPAGKTLYAYHRFYGPSSTGGPFADESHLLVLTVLFSPSDVVEKHLFSHTRPNVSTRMGRAGREFTTEELGLKKRRRANWPLGLVPTGQRNSRWPGNVWSSGFLPTPFMRPGGLKRRRLRCSSTTRAS